MLRVILIDDENAPIEIMEYFIEEYFTDVQIVATAKDIEDGFLQINRHAPDLIFLDHNIPPGFGFDLLKRFPERNFDVVMLTAHYSIEEEAKQYNILGFMHKPIDLDELKSFINLAREHKKQLPDK